MIARFVVEGEDGAGSVYACSLACAKYVAEDQGAKVISCEGSFDVDAYAECEGWCEW